MKTQLNSAIKRQLRRNMQKKTTPYWVKIKAKNRTL